MLSPSHTGLSSCSLDSSNSSRLPILCPHLIHTPHLLLIILCFSRSTTCPSLPCLELVCLFTHSLATGWVHPITGTSRKLEGEKRERDPSFILLLPPSQAGMVWAGAAILYLGPQLVSATCLPSTSLQVLFIASPPLPPSHCC